MDVVVKVTVFYVGVQPPYAGEKKCSGENLSRVAEKNFQEGAFPAGESAFFGVFGETATFRIEGDVAKLQEI